MKSIFKISTQNNFELHLKTLAHIIRIWMKTQQITIDEIMIKWVLLLLLLLHRDRFNTVENIKQVENSPVEFVYFYNDRRRTTMVN